MTGIYIIINMVNAKVYVGQSSDIVKRWNQHVKELNAGRHHNYHLQSAWNMYGQSNFLFELITECDKKDLNKYEKFFINLFNSKKDGYNLDDGGSGTRGFVHTAEQLDKMRKAHNTLCVLQFDQNFNLIQEFIGGCVHAAKTYKYTKESILSRCEHRSKQLLYKNSYWVYKYEYDSDEFTWDNFLNNKPCGIRPSCIKNTFIPICQYNTQKQLIHTWTSYKELKDAGYESRRITTICKHHNNQKTYKGYIWTYNTYDWSDGYFDSILNPINISNQERQISIKQIDRSGNIIIYNSISAAARSLGCATNSHICDAIKNHKIAYGYAWATLDDNWYSDYNVLKDAFKCYDKHQSKTIIQLSLNNDVLNIYKSGKEIETALHISYPNVIRAAKNNLTAGGYKWQII